MVAQLFSSVGIGTYVIFMFQCAVALGFTREFEVRWNDLDPNRHVANIAYASFMTDTRFAWLAESGVNQQVFQEMQVGPVILAETYVYRREVGAFETVMVDLQLQGLSEDTRFGRFLQHVYKQDTEVAVMGRITFAWMDLSSRRVVRPPERLAKLIESIPKTDDFRLLTKADLAKS